MKRIIHIKQDYPIKTLGNPVRIVPPCMVGSPMRAAGIPPNVTVIDPMATESGGPTQMQVSPTTEAGWPPINTVGQPGPMMGPPTWGMGGTPGVTIGQICISSSLAAGCPMISLF